MAAELELQQEGLWEERAWLHPRAPSVVEQEEWGLPRKPKLEELLRQLRIRERQPKRLLPSLAAEGLEESEEEHLRLLLLQLLLLPWPLPWLP